MDIKKAFETIDHKLLLQKLHFLGFRGVANSWLANNLSKRMQYVEVCDSMSDLLQVKWSATEFCTWPFIVYFIY